MFKIPPPHGCRPPRCARQRCDDAVGGGGDAVVMGDQNHRGAAPDQHIRRVAGAGVGGDAAEGMLVTMPKRYDQDPTNQGIVDALKADKKDPSGPMSGSPTRRCNLWQLPLNVPAAMSRWRW